MEDTGEKRHDSRSKHGGSVLCANFNMSNWAVAKVVDCSKDGMFLVSDAAYCPGAPVVIRTKDFKRISPHLPGSGNEEMRQTTLAEVKWCQPASENPSVFEMSVRYYAPWY